MRDDTKLKRYTSLAGAIDMLIHERLALLNPAKWDDTNDTHFLGAFMDCKKAKSIYAACFTQAAETYHHWQVFAGNNEGVCVEFDREALLTHVSEMSGMVVGNMNYRTLGQLRMRTRIKADDLPFLKRKGFGDEKEFRILHYSKKVQQPVYQLPIQKEWIKRIIINPWLSEGLYQSMKTALKAIPNAKGIKIAHTSLINNAEWKNACDKVIELDLIHSRPKR